MFFSRRLAGRCHRIHVCCSGHGPSARNVWYVPMVDYFPVALLRLGLLHHIAIHRLQMRRVRMLPGPEPRAVQLRTNLLLGRCFIPFFILCLWKITLLHCVSLFRSYYRTSGLGISFAALQLRLLDTLQHLWVFQCSCVHERRHHSSSDFFFFRARSGQ
jgi:hypothetical protein